MPVFIDIYSFSRTPFVCNEPHCQNAPHLVPGVHFVSKLRSFHKKQAVLLGGLFFCWCLKAWK